MCILGNKGEILAYLHLLILYKVIEEYGELRAAFFWVVTQRVMVISLVKVTTIRCVTTQRNIDPISCAV
jgi:hypothetical protein